MILSSPSSRQAKGFAVLAGSNMLARAFVNACPLDHRATIHAYFPGKRIVCFLEGEERAKKVRNCKTNPIFITSSYQSKRNEEIFSNSVISSAHYPGITTVISLQSFSKGFKAIQSLSKVLEKKILFFRKGRLVSTFLPWLPSRNISLSQKVFLPRH